MKHSNQLQKNNLGFASIIKNGIYNASGSSCQYQCVYKILSKDTKCLKTYGHFHSFTVFCLGLDSDKKKGIWQTHLLDFLGISLCVKYFQRFPTVQESWPFSLTTTDERTRKSLIGHTPKVNRTIGRSTFPRVIKLQEEPTHFCGIVRASWCL